MEYDNDRIVKGTYKTEFYCWLFFLLIYPLVNGLGVFPHQKTTWILLLAVSLFLLPLYLLYARMIVTKFLFSRKYLIFGILTLLFAGLIHGLLFLVFKIALSFVRGPGQDYFSYSSSAFPRETAWMLINACFAIALAWLRAKTDPKKN